MFAREGVLALIDTRPMPLSARTLIALGRLIERPSAKDGTGRLSAALTRLGPTYVKLGQFLATRPDVVGAALARDLESLQDKMAPFSQAEAEASVVLALGKPLTPGFEAPVLLAYSARNRSASCRIPYTTNPKAKRVEVRFPDPLANPYLGFAAMLMAGLDGIKNKLHPGDAMDKDLYDLPPAELKQIPTVCGSLREALESLDKGRAFLKAGGVFDDDFIDSYIELKMTEVIRFEHTPHPVEYVDVLLGVTPKTDGKLKGRLRAPFFLAVSRGWTRANPSPNRNATSRRAAVKPAHGDAALVRGRAIGAGGAALRDQVGLELVGGRERTAERQPGAFDTSPRAG